MMNLFAVSLVVTSLATAGVLSPSLEKQKTREDVILKEVHRVVVVEYEKEDDGNTKVSMSPHEPHVTHKPRKIDEKSYLSATEQMLSEAAAAVKERIEEASSVLPNVGQGLSGSHPQSNGHSDSPSPGDLICDAFGKCKDKIASAFGKTKEKVSEKAHEVEEEAKEVVSETVDGAKDTVSHKGHVVSDKVHSVGEGAKEVGREALGKVYEVGERVKEVGHGALSKMRETVSQKAHGAEEGAKDAVRKAEHGAEVVVDKVERIGEHIERNVSGKIDKAKGLVEEKAKQAGKMAEQAVETVKTGAKRLKEEGQKDLNDILLRGREVVYDAIMYVMSPETTDSLMGVVHLLGFSTAYGMCMWVTFVSSYVLAEALPRQQFGLVQSKIYPVYFSAMASCVGIALLGHFLSQRRLSSSTAEMFQGYNLLATILMLLGNLLYLEPRATKVMFERMKVEKEEGRGRDGLIDEPSSRVSDRVADPTATTATAPSHNLLMVFQTREEAIIGSESFAAGNGRSGETNNMKDTIVLYPAPGIGHMVSMVELGKLILHRYHHKFTINILITTGFLDSPSTTSYIHRISQTTPSIIFHRLPSLSVDTSPIRSGVAIVFDFIRLNAPNVHRSLLEISNISAVRAFIIDFFCTSALPIAAGLGIPTYYFFTSGAAALAAYLYFPTIHKQTSKSFKDLISTELDIPGLPPVRATHMPEPILDRNDPAYDDILYFSLHLPKSEGIIVNTFEELEPIAIKAIADGICVPDVSTPPVFYIGPLIAEAENRSSNNENDDTDRIQRNCLSWLDTQPRRSVVFLCFGSRGSFLAEQVKEIANGLERSGQRFLWVVPKPRGDDKSNDVRALTGGFYINGLMPEGFLERTKGRGMVVDSWAPQVAVLSHESVGGFVTHCGWNSVLEAVVAGVPMVAWPLYAEQHLNKAALVEDMKMAIPLEHSEDGFVSGEEVERRIRELMESERGRELRERSQKMKEMASDAWLEFGSSTSALAKLVQVWSGSNVET
ncbi:hypothetical protein F0562_002975 [Nyssa sinensis]|uniref:TMEM205-like domain-containing protein n=1 Tax=Nyssa sinensis TaxID=561372 RepID=A0A5J5BUB0_9ASTE|nr:hypothetical protein F0562_002975 [Nyssa sinensis]